MREALLVATLLAALAGCATRPISNSEAVPAPVERILAPSLLQPSAESGKVTVKRDSGFGGSACTSRVFVDAKPVADLRASEKVVVYLPAGEHIFSAWPNGICGGGMSEVRATVKVGAEISFRIGYGSNGDFTINATAF
jgi:type IV pilus biogenesis protein CpaD/CtpE